MTIKGIVKNGVVVLPDDVKLPEGIEVQVEVADELWDEDEWKRRYQAFRAVVGLGCSGIADTSSRKHEVLAGVYADERANPYGDETENVVR